MKMVLNNAGKNTENIYLPTAFFTKSAWAAEYTNCLYAEG